LPRFERLGFLARLGAAVDNAMSSSVTVPPPGAGSAWLARITAYATRAWQPFPLQIEEIVACPILGFLAPTKARARSAKAVCDSLRASRYAESFMGTIVYRFSGTAQPVFRGERNRIGFPVASGPSEAVCTRGLMRCR
jgi:hypothetical protein